MEHRCPFPLVSVEHAEGARPFGQLVTLLVDVDPYAYDDHVATRLRKHAGDLAPVQHHSFGHLICTARPSVRSRVSATATPATSESCGRGRSAGGSRAIEQRIELPGDAIHWRPRRPGLPSDGR